MRRLLPVLAAALLAACAARYETPDWQIEPTLPPIDVECPTAPESCI